jgi:lipid A 4'-phosphatase
MRGLGIYAGMVALVVAVFLLVPQIDLATSRLFYAPGDGFVLAEQPPIVFLYHSIPWIGWGIVLFAALAAIWLFLLGRPLWRLDRKALAFLIAAVALGPGLVANTLLKDHWGRARPLQIEAFGGPHRFTAAPLPATECAHNCAFVSGHAALGFSLVAFALLLPPGGLRRFCTAAALCAGLVVGLGRIAQGAHFLSDVLYAGLLVYGMTGLLYWLIVERDALAAPLLIRLYRLIGRGAAAGWAVARRACESPGTGLALAAAAAMILTVISIGFVDRPLAIYLRARDPDLRTLFDVIGRLGLTWGYLAIFGVVFVALHWGGLAPRLRPFAVPMRALSAVPAFLFLAIGASGVVVDLMKIVFGRPRPKLLFGSEVYDFNWLNWHPDHWSFPSGHSATIVALMTALWYLWPRHVLFYVLAAAIVALSRVAVGAHYLSDVLAGALVAIVTTRYAALSFARSGIDLTAARLGLGASKEGPPWPCRLFAKAPASENRPISSAPAGLFGPTAGIVVSGRRASPGSAEHHGPAD